MKYAIKISNILIEMTLSNIFFASDLFFASSLKATGRIPKFPRVEIKNVTAPTKANKPKSLGPNTLAA